mmetsp:Transcript_17073/g.33416  ORF Transcript_17073/g.33416 Transcript_17073/m.33416 type:complete len:322 (+) Transcript_17073:605-1570(+)
MPHQKDLLSRHGTLSDDDTLDAVAVDTIQVLKHCATDNTKDYFGATGKLPPKSAQIVEPHYVPYHTFRDDKDDTDWIGLKMSTNALKGRPDPVLLSPGEYKLELKLPKALNRNVAYDTAGAIIGSISTLTAADEDAANEAYMRGLPTAYVDVQIIVRTKKYSLLSTRGMLDLGVHSHFVRTWAVQPHEGNVELELKMHSHSVLKRLKVEAVLYRRDFRQEEENAAEARRKMQAERGKAILQKALSVPKTKGRRRLDPDVKIQDVVYTFYHHVAPERLPNLDFVFQHFAERDDDLINTLEAKYHVRFDNRGNFVLADDHPPY